MLIMMTKDKEGCDIILSLQILYEDGGFLSLIPTISSQKTYTIRVASRFLLYFFLYKSIL